jgi:hypothetical protein
MDRKQLDLVTTAVGEAIAEIKLLEMYLHRQTASGFCVTVKLKEALAILEREYDVRIVV